MLSRIRTDCELGGCLSLLSQAGIYMNFLVRKDISNEDWQFEVVTSSKYVVHNEGLLEGKRSK